MCLFSAFIRVCIIKACILPTFAHNRLIYFHDSGELKRILVHFPLFTFHDSTWQEAKKQDLFSILFSPETPSDLAYTCPLLKYSTVRKYKHNLVCLFAIYLG